MATKKVKPPKNHISLGKGGSFIKVDMYTPPNGKPLLSVRKFFTNDAGEEIPVAKQGLTLPVDTAIGILKRMVTIAATVLPEEDEEEEEEKEEEAPAAKKFNGKSENRSRGKA